MSAEVPGSAEAPIGAEVPGVPSFPETPEPSPASLRENVRRLPRPVWLLFAGQFLNSFGQFLLPFLVLYLTGRGYSAAQAGLAASAYGVGGLGAVSVGGLLADRIGRRSTIVLSMLGSAAFTLAFVGARSLVVIVALTALVGFSANLYRPAAAALVADLVPAPRRVSAFAVHRLMINFGWAVGLSVGGFLADRSFTALFVADAATSFAFAAIALAFLPHGVRASRHEERRGEASRSLLADRGFLLFLGGIFFSALTYMQMSTTFALQVKAAGHSSAVYGLLLALNGAIIVLAELPFASVTQRRPVLRMVALGCLLVGGGFALLALGGSLVVLVAAVTVWTIGEMLQSPTSAAFAAGRAPAHVRGRYQGAVGTMYSGAFIVGPTLGAIVFGLSPTALWLGCGVLGAVAAALTVSAGRRHGPSPVPLA